MDYERLLNPLELLHDCTNCPRNCHANRFTGKTGYCRSDASLNIASICVHRGEEPVISGHSGICNIFFTNCNLQCIYCQNHQISDRHIRRNTSAMTLTEALGQITAILDSGVELVGFVSPSHFVPQMLVIIREIEAMGYSPGWVYNTNGYDKAETLRSLEGIIDVYLPDFKYYENQLAYELSDAMDYPEIASRALREIFRQKGATLITDNNGRAVSGMIIRHLVLPGQVENSIKVLQFIANDLSPRIHISLMAQYYPPDRVAHHPFLFRGITADEYDLVKEEMERLGICNGWIQDLGSGDHYQPDFSNEHPFERT